VSSTPRRRPSAPRSPRSRGDVTNPADLDRIYAQTGRERGRVDIVFANAGAADRAPFGSITEEHLDKVVGTNVKGLVFTAQKAVPLMPDGGTIILTGSGSAIKAWPARASTRPRRRPSGRSRAPGPPT
jgi:NAD(P)-dependent dehydrogenase (short-subunit alcohol dehydrogenase family)